MVHTALEAFWNNHCRFPHALLKGPPGLGKTELARVIAKDTAAPCMRCWRRTYAVDVIWQDFS